MVNHVRLEILNNVNKSCHDSKNRCVLCLNDFVKFFRGISFLTTENDNPMGNRRSDFHFKAIHFFGSCWENFCKFDRVAMIEGQLREVTK